ncbi:MAG: hypothetical protein NTZ74_08440 [Chloroflexi bacterium]|nr:hypothetical protein [Chloroflexota bacterium]
MEKIKSLLARPLVTGIVGVVVGLIIGLPLLGWWVWPVQWKDADASFLRQDLKDQYLCMVVDSYRINQDTNLAAARIDSLGLDITTSPFMFDTLQKGGCSYLAGDADILALKSTLSANATTGVEPLVETTQVVSPSSIAKPASKTSVILLSLLCALFLIIGGALVYIFFIKNRKNGDQVPPKIQENDYLEEDSEYETDAVPAKSIQQAPPAEGPVAHFMTTYVIGDDLYDDSFSIDAQTGEFLGECGVGISDTIGVGDPKKITAFEVWLFDKNDIQTVTKVLMSSHAINDPAIRQRLASKGEPVLVEPGQQILLETATLQLEARVIEMVYGQGALPSGSFFERLTLEIAVWPK